MNHLKIKMLSAKQHTTKSVKRVRAIGIMALALLQFALASCHRSANKETSDIAGIIPAQGVDTEMPAMEARYTNWPDPDTMLIYIDDMRYKAASDGNVIAPDGKTKFSLGNEGKIEQLFFLQMGNSLFLFYSDVTPNGTASFARRIDLPTGRALWTSDVMGVALSKPIIKGQFAYISSFGFVGKLKLKNGQYDWKYTNLNSAGRFEKFQHIKFPSKREVVFVAPHPFSLESDTVVINDMTGEIIRMN